MLRVFGRYVYAATLVLGIAEAAIVCAVIYAGAAIFSGDIVDLPPNLALWAAVIATIVVVAMHSIGLYDHTVLTDLRQSLIKLAFIIGPIFMLAVVTTGLLAKDDVVAIYPFRWQWTIALTTFWFASILGGRLVFAHLHHKGKLARRVVLLGGPQLFRKLHKLVSLGNHPIQIVAQLDRAQSAVTPDQGSSESVLLRALETANAHSLVFDQALLSKASIAELLRCRAAGIPVIEVTQLFERETGRVDLESVEPQALLFSRGLRQSSMFDFVKRSLDIAGAIVGIVLFAPVMLVAALALRLEGSGPVLYRQARVGRDGNTFLILKFRSMRADAEQNGIPRWACERDPRITPVGRIIRKVRIDELPQFLNVLRGDMSLVGPRPERPYFVRELGASLPFYHERHVVRPGITGWAQVNFRYGASLDDAAQKHSYDLYYLKHRSTAFDLIILLKTVRIVLFGEGAW